jgi:hypothetical protein
MKLAAVPGAEVTVSRPIRIDTVCDHGRCGQYAFPNLPVRPTSWSEAERIRAFDRRESWCASARRAPSTSNSVGGMNETIKVSGRASRHEYVGTVTTQETIVGLPLNGRSATRSCARGGAVRAAPRPNRLPWQVAISVAGGGAAARSIWLTAVTTTRRRTPATHPSRRAQGSNGERRAKARFGMSTGARSTR